MKKIILLLMFVLPAGVHAELTPDRGEYDPRVRVVDYNPMNVVKLSTFYGVSTHVQFSEAEKIKDVAVGDDLAWKVVQRGNHLFIKPQAEKADTNVTVITSKRSYQFALVVQPRPLTDSKAWADPNLIFSLKFRYPDEEAEKANALTVTQLVKNKLSEYKKTSPETQNNDYWVVGSEEISPTSARDDGRFIYLQFNNNRDMPAVYSVDDDGKEALINTHVIDGDTIVVQRLVKKIMLRKGDYVAAVLNKSFDQNGGIDNTTGTVVPNVERVVKGVN